MVDAYNQLDAELGTTGKLIVLPATFVGGPRYLLNLFQDAMAIVRKFGKPDLFITITCNPKWPEITDRLGKGQTAQDIPDIVSRVFSLKLKAVCDLLFKKHIFGRAKAQMHIIEFQKRGNYALINLRLRYISLNFITLSIIT